MTVYNWLCLLGIPSLVGALVAALIASAKKQSSESKALRLGLQALLRAQMITDYNKWNPKGYAPIYARENFLNVYAQYHSLGANGVMDDIKDKFLALPTEPPRKE